MRGPGTSPDSMRSRRASVFCIRAHVHHARKAKAREHVLHLIDELARGKLRGVVPFRSREMDIAVLESCQDIHSAAIQLADTVGNVNTALMSDGGNFSITNDNHAVVEGYCEWRNVDSRSNQCDFRVDFAGLLWKRRG